MIDVWLKEITIMSRIAEHLTDLIGNTPLLALNNYGKALEKKAKILANSPPFS